MTIGREMLNLDIRYIIQSDDRLAVSNVYEESWKRQDIL